MEKIITTPDPRLRERSSKVSKITDEIHDIIAAMVSASLDWENKHPYELSAAMAAPQLGINKRIIIDHIRGKKDTFFHLDDKGNMQPLDYDTEVAGNTNLFPKDD